MYNDANKQDPFFRLRKKKQPNKTNYLKEKGKKGLVNWYIMKR